MERSTRSKREEASGKRRLQDIKRKAALVQLRAAKAAKAATGIFPIAWDDSDDDNSGSHDNRTSISSDKEVDFISDQKARAALFKDNGDDDEDDFQQDNAAVDAVLRADYGILPPHETKQEEKMLPPDNNIPASLAEMEKKAMESVSALTFTDTTTLTTATSTIAEDSFQDVAEADNEQIPPGSPQSALVETEEIDAEEFECLLQDGANWDEGEDTDEDGESGVTSEKEKNKKTKFLADFNTRLDEKVDFALRTGQAEEMPLIAKIIRRSSEYDLKQETPEDSHPFVKDVMAFILRHPDVEEAMQGRWSQNLRWYMQRINLSAYLEYVWSRPYLRPWANLLWESAKRQKGDPSSEEIIEFLESFSEKVPEIMDTRDTIESIKADKRTFHVYFNYMEGYPDHFHWGKVSGASLRGYFSANKKGIERRQTMLPKSKEDKTDVDLLRGYVVCCFDDDPLHSRLVGSVPDVLRWLIKSTTEVVGHIVVCGLTSITDIPGCTIYGDCYIRGPDDRNFRRNLRQFTRDFDAIIKSPNPLADANLKNSYKWMLTTEDYDLHSEYRRRLLSEHRFITKNFQFKVLRGLTGLSGASNYNADLTRMANYLVSTKGRLPPNKSAEFDLMNSLNKYRDGRKGATAMKVFQDLLFRATFSEAKRIEKQYHPLFSYLYGQINGQKQKLSLIAIRPEPEKAIDFVFKLLESACKADNRALFCYEGKSAADMSDEEIAKSGIRGWDVSDVGRALALNALKQMPEARFFYVERPPVTRFYSEQTLRGATATQLMEIRKEECLTQDGSSKENSIKLILRHQKDRDMTGRQFEPIPDDGSAARDAAKDERRNRMLEAVQLCMSGNYTYKEALLRVGFSPEEAGKKSNQAMLSWWKNQVKKTAQESAAQEVDE